MKSRRNNGIFDIVTSQKGLFTAVTVSGLIYNIGLAAGPWFEGRLAQCLLGVFEKERTFSDMLVLSALYVLTILTVQGARFLKRLCVRKFGNGINRSLKRAFYRNLLSRSPAELKSLGAGNLLSRAIGDADACSEGIRKFTTELFDTGVALITYTWMLLFLDWRLTLCCLIFPLISYIAAERMKTVIERTGTASRESAGRLSETLLDRIAGAVTYRSFGCEARRDAACETAFADYETRAVCAGIPQASLQPLYEVISMGGVLLILYFGGRNVLGTGRTGWDIAAFTTFLSCFTKLAVKSSHAGKLFNAVRKAQVSWKRICDYLTVPEAERELPSGRLADGRPKAIPQAPAVLTGEKLAVSLTDFRKEPLFSGLSFRAAPGAVIGVTGPIACGKSTFGRLFTGEFAYDGNLRFGDEEFSRMSRQISANTVGYLGHDPELFRDTIRNNILLGDDGDVWDYLRAVCLDEEVRAMRDGIDTIVGDGGVRLSGGQQKRLALARTLAHPRPLIILDDPFSALDTATERQIFRNLRRMTAGSTMILISHRLQLFSQTDGVIFLEHGRARFADHETLLKEEPLYLELCRLQEEGEASCGNARDTAPPDAAVIAAGARMTAFGTSDNAEPDGAVNLTSNDPPRRSPVLTVLLQAFRKNRLLCPVLFLTVIGAAGVSLLPPLVLERIVDGLTAAQGAGPIDLSGSSSPDRADSLSYALPLLYPALLALSGLLAAAREGLLVVLGQRITHALRTALCQKESLLLTGALVHQEPGAVVSLLIGDTDTVEALFTSGIISMCANMCELVGILAVIFTKSPGLTLVLVLLLPLLFLFTRAVQKAMLSAQTKNRAAIARVSGHLPETLRCIRTIHLLQKEDWFQDRFGRLLDKSYQAAEQNNFYDAVYSPVILTVNALSVAIVMLAAASGNARIHALFGMSVGTAVAVISYLSRVFSPIETIGMEIQTIQSAAAGIGRIRRFLALPERVRNTDSPVGAGGASAPAIELRGVSFGYEETEPEILKNLSFSIASGENVTFTGRTGAGKSTIFKLLLGLYRPQKGQVLICGREAAGLPDSDRRTLIGYVPQDFYRIPGTIRDQITLGDTEIPEKAVISAARLSGIHEVIKALPSGYDTPCTDDLFSQGQRQLIAIARAVVRDPAILLLDEITADLDADTELAVLRALQSAGKNRTVLSISHRLYTIEQNNGREIRI